LGKNLLKSYRKIRFDEIPNLDTLQMWTEADLEKLAETRAKPKYNKKIKKP